MSLLNTKPRYCPEAVATDRGWVNPKTKELLVSVRNLKTILGLTEIAPVAPIRVKRVNKPETKPRKPYAARQPKVIGEVTENKLPVGQQLIGEVVEYKLETPVIGE